jgi:glutathione synthase/RimK-type ligase-like ATP-grasp enzyme
VILVVSYPGEEHAAEVIKLLEKQGREVVLMDLAEFPARAGLSLQWPATDKPSYVIDRATDAWDLRNVRVAWWRRVRPFAIDEAIVNNSVRAFVASETSQAVGGMLDALPCIWVNPRAADDAAHQKPYQWTVATGMGMRVPRTLVTNRPESARRFIDEIGVGKTVFKAFLASQEAWRETRLIEQADVDRLDSVRFAPVVFQEFVAGIDLRITVVGDKIFAAQIDARNTPYPVDMRMVVGEADVQVANLPPKVRNAILKLQRRLGLYYGAIDMRVTDSGEYFFLEVNPAGQWLFVEHRTGLPISQAVADLLTGLADSRVTIKRENQGSNHSAKFRR